MSLYAFGIGIGTCNAKDEWLEVFYPRPLLQPDGDEWEEIGRFCGYDGKGNVGIRLDGAHLKKLADLRPELAALEGTHKPVLAVFLATDAAPTSVPETYLKLHLLSHRLVKPNGTKLDGMFKILPNVAWTTHGAIDPEELPARQLAARLKGETLSVLMLDKFPRMTDYVAPTGVRIADTARVRLGAYVGAGTTVMQEGFINFNGGTEGPNMVEGRVSAGVFMAAGTDLGGGASTMGTLSGGGDVVISVGRNCLIGANAGLGIPLGDDCTVEAGLYLTAASKVKLVNRDGTPAGAGPGAPAKVVKARELAGRSGLLFRRNSQNGAIECLPVKSAAALNADLHSNN